jgi:hypothetical protein
MEAKLLHIPWAVSVLYTSIPLFWFAIHPFADRWRNMHRSPYRLLLPIWAVIIFGLGWITWPWRLLRFYSTPWTWVPAVFLLWYGLRTYAAIQREFGGHKLSGIRGGQRACGLFCFAGRQCVYHIPTHDLD